MRLGEEGRVEGEEDGGLCGRKEMWRWRRNWLVCGRKEKWRWGRKEQWKVEEDWKRDGGVGG